MNLKYNVLVETRTLETLTSVRFPFLSIFTTCISSNDSSRVSASRSLFSRASNTLMAYSKIIHVRKHTPTIIHGTWLLDAVSVTVRRRGRQCTYRGLYLSIHMNCPAALPMQYAENMMAFVVTLLVCPAVVCDTQDKDNTKQVISITVYARLDRSES